MEGLVNMIITETANHVNNIHEATYIGNKIIHILKYVLLNFCGFPTKYLKHI